MRKKSFLTGFLLIFGFLASGCTLAKGVAGCAQGASEGFKDDMVLVNKADNWIKDNLW